MTILVALTMCAYIGSLPHTVISLVNSSFVILYILGRNTKVCTKQFPGRTTVCLHRKVRPQWPGGHGSTINRTIAHLSGQTSTDKPAEEFQTHFISGNLFFIPNKFGQTITSLYMTSCLEYTLSFQKMSSIGSFLVLCPQTSPMCVLPFKRPLLFYYVSCVYKPCGRCPQHDLCDHVT